MKVYQKLGSLLQKRVEARGWHAKCSPSFKLAALGRIAAAGEDLKQHVTDHLPSGSGFDAGCELDFLASHPSKVVIRFGYHHMNDLGYYVGWTHWKLEIRPLGFTDYSTRLTLDHKHAGGRQYLPAPEDLPTFRSYLLELFDEALQREVL